MSSEAVIRASSLSKAYAIFERPEDRLKQMLALGRRKYYREYWALRDISFEVRRGESVAIIGRNGSGKSTLLQLVTGTLKPTSGTVEVSGRVGAMLELGAGFNPEFTGRENLLMSGVVLGLTQRQLAERFASIAEFAAIGDFIDQPVKLYSSGMYARLAFALMAHIDPDVLIIDEILAVGDSAFAQKCMRFIRDFRDRGTLLLVSHDTAAVLALCDLAIWLDAGHVRGIGPAKEMCRLYQASIEAEKDQTNSFRIGGSRRPELQEQILPTDSRQTLLQELNLVPTARVSPFDPNAPWFGQRGASVELVALLDGEGRSLTSFQGGEDICLRVECIAHQAIERPIIGFFVKDRLGQAIFGDNTVLTYLGRAPAAADGSLIRANFKFRVPFLQAGRYAITVAVADGDQEHHVQHHWVDDALLFEVNTRSTVRGLVGIPMRAIELEVGESRRKEGV